MSTKRRMEGAFRSIVRGSYTTIKNTNCRLRIRGIWSGWKGTFDNSDDYLLETGRKGVSADIYISVDTVRINGRAYGEGFAREMHRVIVHGLLHLIGYDDCDDWHRCRMRAAENRALALLDKLTEA